MTQAPKNWRARGLACLLLPVLLLVHSIAAAGSLRIEALRGEGTNNNPAAGTGVSVVVRVLDEAGKPVPGALVAFAAPPAGPSVEFGVQGAEAAAATDELGLAVSPRPRPVGGNGPVEIRITASHGGEFARAVVHQMNLGVGGGDSRETELSVVKLPLPAGQPPDRSTLRVKVEDGNGRPAVSAEVQFILRRLESGGKVREIARVSARTDSAGEATGQTPLPAGRGRLEFCVTAATGGHFVTAYFPVN